MRGQRSERVSFAFALDKAKLRRRAPGLTPRQALAKLAALQMLDVHFPTTDGRELIFTRYTQPEPDQQMILAQLNWTLPPQPPPRISAKREVQRHRPRQQPAPSRRGPP